MAKVTNAEVDESRHYVCCEVIICYNSSLRRRLRVEGDFMVGKYNRFDMNSKWITTIPDCAGQKCTHHADCQYQQDLNAFKKKNKLKCNC